jgi:hypothetical protein
VVKDGGDVHVLVGVDAEHHHARLGRGLDSVDSRKDSRDAEGGHVAPVRRRTDSQRRSVERSELWRCLQGQGPGLGTKLAETWLSSLVLPGFLYVAALLTASRLRQDHSLDAGLFVERAEDLATSLQKQGSASIILALLAAALLASVVALTARGAGVLMGRLWQGNWPGPLAEPLTQWRRDRWDRADQDVADSESSARETGDAPADRDRLAARRNRIALAHPVRPTWIGDRTAAVAIRVEHAYGIDLETAWPRLWLTADDAARTEVEAAKAAVDRAVTLSGWGVLYVVMGLYWWPASLAGSLVWATGWYRTRSAIAMLSDLIESVVDLTVEKLAIDLRVLAEGQDFTPEIADAVTRRIRKGT